MDNILLPVKEVTSYLEKHLLEKRFTHSLRTAQTAKKLCHRYNLPAEKCFFAGLVHDICKNCDDDTLRELAKRDGLPLEDFEKENPVLLHGRAGSIFLQEEFAIMDAEILQAVKYHTFGKPHICNTALIVYVADKIEPARPQINAVYCKSLENLSLYELTYKVAKDNCEYISKKNKVITRDTNDFLHWLTELNLMAQ